MRGTNFAVNTMETGVLCVLVWTVLDIKQSTMHHSSVRVAFTLNSTSSITPFVRTEKSSKNIPSPPSSLVVQGDGCG